jgi:hypothetical protein
MRSFTAQGSGSWNMTLFGYTEHEEKHVCCIVE